MTLSEGQLLQGRYRIEHLVARGGYGAVYKAFDTTLNRICAVKENLAFGPHAERQFEREAQLLARLHHPNLPRVIDHFLLPECGQYLVMDYVEGRNLQEILRHRLRPFNQDEALEVIYQVCAALTYLHNQAPPIVHRDVKPQNIIVTPGGPVMLVDFGISKVVYGEGDTMTGAHGVSPGFAAPEQYGMAPADARSDVYAVGATLYTLLTCQVPVDSLQRLTNQVVLPSIHQFNGGVSPAVEQVVYKALEPSVTQRLPSIDLLQQALHTAQSGSKRTGSTRRRSPSLAVMFVGSVALAVIVMIGMLRTSLGSAAFSDRRSNGATCSIVALAHRAAECLASRLYSNGDSIAKCHRLCATDECTDERCGASSHPGRNADTDTRSDGHANVDVDTSSDSAAGTAANYCATSNAAGRWRHDHL